MEGVEAARFVVDKDGLDHNSYFLPDQFFLMGREDEGDDGAGAGLAGDVGFVANDQGAADPIFFIEHGDAFLDVTDANGAMGVLAGRLFIERLSDADAIVFDLAAELSGLMEEADVDL